MNGPRVINVVSVSGGKDSTVTLDLCLESRDREDVRAVFADTGNEHDLTLEYLDYLRGRLNIDIVTIRADLSQRVIAKREYVLTKWPAKGVPLDVCERAAACLVPTGNPFLDLCMWKGRFPSRKAQFCTQELKTIPLLMHQAGIIAEGHAVVSWQGVRRDESENRRCAKMFEAMGDGLFCYRPIVRWSAEQVFAWHAERGIEPNPLYKRGMRRVGCMPCINCRKSELAEIERRFPDHIERIAEWEHIVSAVSKRGASTFFHKGPGEHPGGAEPQAVFAAANIRSMVEWAKTSRGGKQYDLDAFMPAEACASSYGLCE